LHYRLRQRDGTATISGENAMTLSVHTVLTQSMEPMLRSLDGILDKAATHAEATGADLVNARLAPDMYTLAQQVQIVCYFARETPKRLTGGAASEGMGEVETSLAGLKRQVAEALDGLRAVSGSGLEEGLDRDCTFPVPQGMRFELNGEQFLLRWALPNFYFHLVTAYGILRKEGVELGKPDYMSSAHEFIRTEAAD
jgi:uncharacterized protein